MQRFRRVYPPSTRTSASLVATLHHAANLSTAPAYNCYICRSTSRMSTFATCATTLLYPFNTVDSTYLKDGLIFLLVRYAHTRVPTAMRTCHHLRIRNTKSGRILKLPNALPELSSTNLHATLQEHCSAQPPLATLKKFFKLCLSRQVQSASALNHTYHSSKTL